MVYGFRETDPLTEFLLSGHPSRVLLGFRGRRIANRSQRKKKEKRLKMETKNEGVLTSLARTVGTTAGLIVAKTTQLKDEAVKMGSDMVKPAAKKPARKSAAKKSVTKKSAAKKIVAKNASKKRAPAKKSAKKTTAKTRSKRK
jgi:ribonuclease E